MYSSSSAGLLHPPAHQQQQVYLTARSRGKCKQRRPWIQQRSKARGYGATSSKVRSCRNSAAVIEGEGSRRMREEDEGGGGGAQETGVVVVGAGLAGLGAARQLASSGVPFLLVEASDGVGGRVRTDEHQGYLLDRGFQIHITAYPEARRVLDYDALRLQTFYAGAVVWFGGGFHKVADPVRHFADGLLSLANPIGSVWDKVLIGLVRLRAISRSDDSLLSAPESTILARLQALGFSDAIVDRFFRPFFGGIFFDRQLTTTSRLFDFVFKCLALGSNTLPAAGIGAIPAQLADRLPQGSLLLNSAVLELAWSPDGRRATGVRLQGGRCISAKHGVVVAVEGPAAASLLGSRLPPTPALRNPPASTVCLYFTSDKPPPIKDPVLLLNGSDKGIVNNLFFPASVAPSYAPAGKTLVSVSLVGMYEDKSDEELAASVKEELASWFGRGSVDAWGLLRTYRIRLAQPSQAPPTDLLRPPKLQEGLFICGDHHHSATFNAALLSGRRAAEALLADAKLYAP